MSHNKFTELDTGERALIAGFISKIRYVQSRRGKMILMKITDENNNFNVVCWSEMNDRLESKGISLKEETPVRISGIKSISHIGEEQIALGKEKNCYIKILT